MSIKLKKRKLHSLWQKSTKGSMNRQIMGAAIIVGLSTILVKFGSVGKELVVAWRFGTGDELDAFLIALVVPFFVVNVFANSFKAALIPTYIKVREKQGETAAQDLLSTVIGVALLFLGIITILLAIAAPGYLPLLTSGFAPDKLDLTIKLLRAVSPFVFFAGIITIWGSILNAGEKFALTALSPVAIPLTTVILLLLMPSWGIFALAMGLVIGSALEIMILGVAVYQKKLSLIPKWGKFDANLQEVIRQYAPVTAGAFLMCSANLIDRSMAAMLDSGSVAALGYGSQVIALPLNLTTLALGTAVIPYFSKTIAQKDWRKVKHTFNSYLRLILLTSIPLTLVLIFASKLIIKLLFERGSFTAEDTAIVSQIQICYALQIPFYTSAIFVVRLINSLGINYILAWGSAMNLTINIAANYIFLQWFGVKGIALSTSLVYLFSFTFLYIFTRKHLQKIVTNE